MGWSRRRDFPWDGEAPNRDPAFVDWLMRLQRNAISPRPADLQPRLALDRRAERPAHDPGARSADRPQEMAGGGARRRAGPPRRSSKRPSSSFPVGARTRGSAMSMRRWQRSRTSSSICEGTSLRAWLRPLFTDIGPDRARVGARRSSGSGWWSASLEGPVTARPVPRPGGRHRRRASSRPSWSWPRRRRCGLSVRGDGATSPSMSGRACIPARWRRSREGGRPERGDRLADRGARGRIRGPGVPDRTRFTRRLGTDVRGDRRASEGGPGTWRINRLLAATA